ncbi:MAG TPA: MlaD family protein [Thermoleophilaceae bacterium]|nr:MlaD family protein [Thermoleophilaceae bacterium]
MKLAIQKHLGDFIAIIALFAIGIGVGGYILNEQRFRFPVIEETPKKIKLEFRDAQAVIPGQGQTVRVAGVKIGDIAKVEVEDGIAIVTAEIDQEYENVVHADATALLRPKTGLKDMFIELEPGTKGEPVLPDGGRVPVENTAPDIDPDEFLAALDRDTRDYLKLLVSGAGKGLDGRGGDLQETFARLGPIHRDVRDLSRAIATRRRNLKQLVHNYSSLINEVADTDGDLTRLVSASNQVFEAFASVDAEVSQTVAKLPGALRTTEGALLKVDDLGRELGPSLESLRPAFRALDEANRELLPFGKEATPSLRNDIRPFVREARPYVDDLRPAAKDLAAASPDLTAGFKQLNRFFNMAAFNPNGAEPLTGNAARDAARDEGYLYWVAWIAHNTDSLFSTSDGSGPLRRGQLTVSCDTIRDTIAGEAPAAAGLLGFLPLLSDPNTCGTSAP